MPNRSIILLALLVFAASPSPAAEPAGSDEDLVKSCTSELEERLFGDGAHEHAFIVGSPQVEHDGSQASVRLNVASGEGRAISGTCRFRDGKLFDVRQ